MKKERIACQNCLSVCVGAVLCILAQRDAENRLRSRLAETCGKSLSIAHADPTYMLVPREADRRNSRCQASVGAGGVLVVYVHLYTQCNTCWR